MLINKDNKTNELDLKGSLLGVFGEQEYETITLQMQWGDKLLLYSDGVELAFVNDGPDEPLRFRQEFGDVAHMNIQEMCDKLLNIINQEEGSLHPKDDVTIIGIELTG
jgi:serine phosphatase RsbU (regulator of sigma subunit)